MKSNATASTSFSAELRAPGTSSLSPLVALFRLTLRQHLRGRRIWLLVALFLVPAILAVILRSLNRPVSAETLEINLVYYLFAHALAPLTALLFASGMVQDEIEEQTLTYLLLRPVRRGTIYLLKFLATVLTTSLLTMLGIVALYAAIYWNADDLSYAIAAERTWKAAVIFGLGQPAYCAFFGALMLVTRRSLLGGVAYIFVMEFLLANLAFVVRQLTVVYYTRVLALRWLGLPEETLSTWANEWGMDLETAPTQTVAVLRLVTAALVILLASIWRFGRMEFSMKTPDTVS